MDNRRIKKWLSDFKFKLLEYDKIYKWMDGE
jgi:hypothetical protein